MKNPGYGTEQTTSASALLLTINDTVRIGLTVLTGQNLDDGTVVAIQTATQKVIPYDVDGIDDGRRTPIGILDGKCDTTTIAGDKQALVIIHGTYKDSSLLVGYDAEGLALLNGNLIGSAIITF